MPHQQSSTSHSFTRGVASHRTDSVVHARFCVRAAGQVPRASNAEAAEGAAEATVGQEICKGGRQALELR